MWYAAAVMGVLLAWDGIPAQDLEALRAEVVRQRETGFDGLDAVQRIDTTITVRENGAWWYRQEIQCDFSRSRLVGDKNPYKRKFIGDGPFRGVVKGQAYIQQESLERLKEEYWRHLTSGKASGPLKLIEAMRAEIGASPHRFDWDGTRLRMYWSPRTPIRSADLPLGIFVGVVDREMVAAVEKIYEEEHVDLQSEDRRRLILKSPHRIRTAPPAVLSRDGKTMTLELSRLLKTADPDGWFVEVDLRGEK